MLGLPLSSQYSGSTISYKRLKSTALSIFRSRVLLWHQAVYPHDLHYIPIHFPRFSIFLTTTSIISYTCENAQLSLDFFDRLKPYVSVRLFWCASGRVKKTLLRSVFSDFPARRMRAFARCMIPPRRGWRTAPIPPSGLHRDPRTFQQSAGLLEPARTLTGRTCCSHPRWRTGCSFPEDWTKEKRPAFQQGVCVVRPTGFEPAAYRVGVCHSIQLSYERKYI